MTSGHRSNIYLQADAIRNLETLFTRLQEAGEIPAKATVADVGEYRSKIITYALQLAVEAESLITGGEKANA